MNDYDLNVSDDSYDTEDGAKRFAEQRAASRPGRIVAVAVEVFRFGETDQEHARNKGNFRVVWSEDRNAIDLYLEAHYDIDVEDFRGVEYEVIHEAGPPESIVIGKAFNQPDGSR